MTVLLVCLMAYQVTGQAAHEYLGVLMILLVAVHNWLDRRWYGALARGGYSAARAARTVVNISLALCVAALAWSGGVMSGYALTFLNMEGMMSAARVVHLAASYWCFALAGIHIGMHVRIRSRPAAAAALAVAAYGAYIFAASEIPMYMTLSSQFVSFDYDEPAASVFAKDIAMLIAWIASGYIIIALTSSREGKK